MAKSSQPYTRIIRIFNMLEDISKRILDLYRQRAATALPSPSLPKDERYTILARETLLSNGTSHPETPVPLLPGRCNAECATALSSTVRIREKLQTGSTRSRELLALAKVGRLAVSPWR